MADKVKQKIIQTISSVGSQLFLFTIAQQADKVDQLRTIQLDSFLNVQI